MRAWLCAVAVAVSGSSPAAVEPAVDRWPTLSIRIHDYADVDAQELQRTQQQVSETYARTAVRLQWRTVVHPAAVAAGRGSWPQDGAPLITVILLGQGMAAPRGVADDVAGYAPITREHGGRIAFVFADRTQKIARRAAVSESSVLSAVVAHEIAHLLMPQRSHSSDGLMRANWVPDQFRWVAQQRFSIDEARAIREMAGALAGGTPRVAD